MNVLINGNLYILSIKCKKMIIIYIFINIMNSLIDKTIQTILIMLNSIILFTIYSIIFIRLFCSNINVICN